MIENKRFIGSSGGVYDQYKSDRFAWSEWEEIIQIMNNLNEKATERSKALSKLQKENGQLQKDATILVYSNQEYRKENDELKKELMEFKKWEKHIGDVKREEFDRVFKMSIYEIAEAFEYYEKRIEKLERSCND